MKIIRDDKLGGLAMIPLFVDWHITRCNWEGCTNRPNTIITHSYEGKPLHWGLCEEHYQEGNVPGGVDMPLEFNDFDAFKPEPEPIIVVAVEEPDIGSWGGMTDGG